MIVFCFSAPVGAAEIFQVEAITIVDPVAYKTSSTSDSTEVYLILNNCSGKVDHLVGIETPVAMSAQILTQQGDDGKKKGVPLGQLKLPPKKEVVLAPGKQYIKLVGLDVPLQEGESFPLILVFERAGSVSVNVKIRKAHAHEDEFEEVSESGDEVSAYSVVYVSVKGGKVSKHQRSIRFTHNERVLIKFVSDEPHELHIHGYNIVVNLDPMGSTLVDFDVSATGRFPVEIHGSNDHHALFYIEVYPD